MTSMKDALERRLADARVAEAQEMLDDAIARYKAKHAD
jgi:hypothetical protein